MEFTDKCYDNCIAGTFSRLLDIHGVEDKEHIISSIHEQVLSLQKGLNPGYVYTDLYKRFRRMTHIDDPCYEMKLEENLQGLEAEKIVKRIIEHSDHRMLDIVKACAAGNLIDVSFGNDFDLENEIRTKLRKPFSIDDSGLLLQAILKVSHIVILADNAGEIILDRLLIDEIQRYRTDHNVEAADIDVFVKAVPILNDALREDALFAGLDKVSNVFDTGCDYIGTPYEYVSDFTRERLNQADIIIAKGLGNYESLYYQENLQKKLFYLLKAKCSVVADMIGAPLNTLVCANGSNIIYK